MLHNFVAKTKAPPFFPRLDCSYGKPMTNRAYPGLILIFSGATTFMSVPRLWFRLRRNCSIFCEVIVSSNLNLFLFIHLLGTGMSSLDYCFSCFLTLRLVPPVLLKQAVSSKNTQITCHGWSNETTEIKQSLPIGMTGTVCSTCLLGSPPVSSV